MRTRPCFASVSQSCRRISSNPLRYSAYAESSDAARAVLMAFLLNALAVVFEIGLSPDERFHQLLFFGQELVNLFGRRRRAGISSRVFRPRGRRFRGRNAARL